ncbi:MAG TPA: potassium channel family protein [Geobacteraceae bacterium]|nr:potassium channel family protein [Geobacteraceae bacterium]
MWFYQGWTRVAKPFEPESCERMYSLKEKFAHLRDYWWGERGLTALLLLLFLAIFLAPLFESIIGKALVGVFFTLLLVSGISTVSSHPAPRLAAGLVAGAAIVLSLLREYYPSRAFMSWWAFSSLVYFVLLTLVLMRQVFREEGEVSVVRVRGAVAAYILVGITFGFLYQLLELRLDTAFNLPNTAGAPGDYGHDAYLLYFSFITLTTVGYGDITAVHPVARMFVIMEALIGQLYPATLLARLVSLEIASRQEKTSTVSKSGGI